MWAISPLYPTPKPRTGRWIHHPPLPQRFGRYCRRHCFCQRSTSQGIQWIGKLCHSILWLVLVKHRRWWSFLDHVQLPPCLSLGWRDGSQTVTIWAWSAVLDVGCVKYWTSQIIGKYYTETREGNCNRYCLLLILSYLWFTSTWFVADWFQSI